MSAFTLKDPVPTFSLAERDRRWNLARMFLDDNGLDALLVFGEHEDAGPAPFCLDTWFTNDRAGTTVLFPRTGEPTVLVPAPVYYYDHLQAARHGQSRWLTAEAFRLRRDVAAIAAALNEQGLAKARIGVIGLQPYGPFLPDGAVPYSLWKNLLDGFPDIEFTPVQPAFVRLMMPLSQEQVAVLTHSAMIGDAMARAMVDTAAAGVSEADVFAAGTAVAHRSGTAVPGMHFRTGPAPVAPGSPQWTYRAQPPRTLQEGDCIASEVFCTSGMHQSQHQVAIAIGTVHDAIERAADVASACYDAGIKAIRAGVRFGDVGEAMLGPVEAVGGWVRGPQIHGLNPYGAQCRIPPSPSGSQILGAQNYPKSAGWAALLGDMELEAGMSFALEPSCGLGNHLVTVGGTVIVGQDGPIELNPSTSRMLRAQA